MKTDFQALSATVLRQPDRLAYGLIPVVNLLRDRGVATEPLLNRAGIEPFGLVDPGYKMTIEQELVFIKDALAHLPEPHASLDLARRYHWHSFSSLGLAAQACGTVGELFDLLALFPRLVWGICNTSVWQRGNELAARYEFALDEDSACRRFLTERDMGCSLVLAEAALGEPMQLTEVRFAYEAPQLTAPYEEFFHCPVTFDAQYSELRFPVTELAHPLPSPDPMARAFYEAQCVHLSADLDKPFSYAEAVHDRLMLARPMPKLEQVARQLNLPPRTLQRRLGEEGKSFSNILQAARLARARRALQDTTQSIDSLALELGFNDAAAFSHAFKSWTGTAPRLWRQQLPARGDARD